jgi:hypothetical protein
MKVPLEISSLLSSLLWCTQSTPSPPLPVLFSILFIIIIIIFWGTGVSLT